jgi:hypothetical protein
LKTFPVSVESGDILLDLDDERYTESAADGKENER